MYKKSHLDPTSQLVSHYISTFNLCQYSVLTIECQLYIMRGMREFNIERGKAIVQLINKGIPLKNIGIQYGISRQRVYQIYKHMVPPYRNNLYRARMKKWEENRKEIMNMLANGMSQNEVARKQKISLQRVHQIKKREQMGYYDKPAVQGQTA